MTLLTVNLMFHELLAIVN